MEPTDRLTDREKDKYTGRQSERARACVCEREREKERERERERERKGERGTARESIFSNTRSVMLFGRSWCMRPYAPII